MKNIVIIGAGSAGLFLADRLAQRGAPPLVIDKQPLAAYSTTRNQGWLQSGAFYAAKASPQLDAVEHCKSGFAEVQRDCPEAILQDIPCYMLFEETWQVESAAEQCRALGVNARPLSDQEFENLQATEGLMLGTRFKGAMSTDDRPINTTVLMTKIANRAEAAGTEFRSVDCVHCVSLKRVRAGWRVALGEGHFEEVSTVVVAAGPYTGELLRVPAAEVGRSLQATKIPVLTLMGASECPSGSMLVAPRAISAPNIVPFRSKDGAGVTICLNGADQVCDERGPLDEEHPHSMSETFLRSLTFWYPAFASLASKNRDNQTTTAHFYMCQKLEGKSRGPILELKHEPGDEGGSGERTLLAVYPGKFTAAPSVADLCLEKLGQVINTLDGPTQYGTGLVPPVARQRYYDTTTHWLRSSDGMIELESILEE